ncbi:lipopolysaccharide biosynthesis protein [Planomonospora sp. ID82291]|uniref:lipopolysaccharide biosynthesis protein n=1 Tax=Planomonospora sp. ID82291 TaxID=2738136 RepID=UPI0018C3D20A|nr:oligosaccharide flippase family protein [Planomonospora sp. ID82291]MBG0818869.1 oligosaccharide flippase family protein [Planomonospora sp. ID82291]
MTLRRTAGGVRARTARLLHGRGWAVGPTVTGAVASGLSAATGLVIAREIGAAAFGHFTVVLTIATILTVGMLMSLNYVMYQELPRAEPADRPALVTTALLASLGLGTALTAAGLLAAAPLTALLGVDVRTLCFSLALAAAMTANQLTESLLRGLKRYARTAVLKLAVAVAYLGGSSYCLLVLGIRDAAFYLVALIATTAAFAVAAVPGLEIAPRTWSAALARSLYRHGAYVTVLAAFTSLVFGVDVIFLNHWAGQADVGVYSVYNGFPKRLFGVLFTDGIGLVLLPALATMDKTAVLRRIGRITPLVAAGTALLSFAAGAVFFLLLREQYPYALGLMALSAAGMGVHMVFNLYSAALLMDGVRGAKVLIACLAAGTPVALACQAALTAWQGLTGALTAFALSNLVLVALVAATAARTYRRADPAAGAPRPRETAP